MAEAAVSFVIQSLSEVLDRINFHTDVHRGVQRLEAELKRMRCFLRDADAKQDDDERVQGWVSDIRNVAYDIEDLVDIFVLRVDSQKKKPFIKKHASVFKEWRHRSKVEEEIQAIQSRISDIAESRETYGIRNVGEGTSGAKETLRKLRRSTPRGEEKDIVGLDDDIAKVVTQLVQREERWHAISIVGMGGIGKTTLAKKVYNHADVRGRFHSRAWVYVSQQFSTRDILMAIIKQVASPRTNMDNLLDEELEEMLYEHLRRKRYLVVLDDIWSRTAWDSLAKAFPNRSNGSRLLLTTRNRNVALHADPLCAPFDLQFLSEENSWELFHKKTFIDGSGLDCSPQLLEIGREIVRNCAGLPLAIIVIGGLLSRKRNLGEWERVLRNMHSLFAQDPNGVSAILALSYNDLPSYLKSCFLYLGHFPEDNLIPTHKLFRLWVAEGLIPNQGERMKEVAEDYLNELIERNMVQVAKVSINERAKFCRLHDLLRDLSISKAKTEDFLEIPGNRTLTPSLRCRRYAMHSGFQRSILEQCNPRVRSLLFFKVDNHKHRNCYASMPYIMSGEGLEYICTSFRLVRILDLEGMTCISISPVISQMIHLKYLGLKQTNLEVLPSSLGTLCRLQTLDLAANLHLKIVPNVLSRMSNLRHIFMCGNKYGGHLQIDTLKKLETLSEIHVNRWIQNNTKNLSSLRKLGLRGSFHSNVTQIFSSIAVLQKLQSLYLYSEDPEFPSLTELSSLHHLIKLRMRGGITTLPKPEDFPPNLSQLTLEHTNLSQNSMELLQGLPKLLTLRLKAHSYSGTSLTIFPNGFPQLEVLQLENLECLEDLDIKEGAMPRLRSFRIVHCGELRMLPEGMKFLKRLRELDIEEMPKVFVDRLRGEDLHKVQHIPSILFV